jgi:hypothetical protein
MSQNSARLLRLRWSDGLDFSTRTLTPRAAIAGPPAPRGTLRFVGRVVNGGAMPSQTERVFLLQPVQLDGPEAEGATASLVADGSRTIPVIVLGQTPPQPGNLLVVQAVGGRWVAQAGASSSSKACSPCPIPQKNLTVSWINTLSGTGSVPLVYSPPGNWNSACSNQLLYALSCPAGQIQFSVTYFLTGDCPKGQQQSCTSPGRNPFSLVLSSFTCKPFFLRYACTVQSCVVLGDDGYTQFTITE